MQTLSGTVIRFLPEAHPKVSANAALQSKKFLTVVPVYAPQRSVKGGLSPIASTCYPQSSKLEIFLETQCGVNISVRERIVKESRREDLVANELKEVTHA